MHFLFLFTWIGSTRFQCWWLWSFFWIGCPLLSAKKVKVCVKILLFITNWNFWKPAEAKWGRAGRPSSVSLAQAPALWLRESTRICGLWRSRSWERRIRKWKLFKRKIRTNLTKKIMIGDIMRTRRSIAIPKACCWFAVFNSLSTVSLKTRNYAEEFLVKTYTRRFRSPIKTFLNFSV